MVGGERPHKAYARIWGVNAKTASEAASRMLSKNAKVKARIDHLRDVRAKIVNKATERAILESARKVTVPLLTPVRRLELLAHFAETSQKDGDALTAIRMDAQLRGELVEKQDLTTDGEAISTAMPTISLQMPQTFLGRRGSQSGN